MLTAKEVADRLRISVQSVYRNKARLGGIQLMPGGAVRFPENCIEVNGNAISDERREMACRESDTRKAENATLFHKGRVKKWEARQILEEWNQEGTEIPSISLIDFFTRYLEVVQEKYCSRTFNEKKLAARTALKVIAPVTEVKEITANQAEAVLRLAAQTSGYAANKCRKNLVAAWEWGKRLYDLPEINPFRQTKKFPADQQPRSVPSMEDF